MRSGDLDNDSTVTGTFHCVPPLLSTGCEKGPQDRRRGGGKKHEKREERRMAGKEKENSVPGW